MDNVKLLKKMCTIYLYTYTKDNISMDYNTNSELSVNTQTYRLRHNYKSTRIHASTHKQTQTHTHSTRKHIHITYIQTFDASTITMATFPSIYVFHSILYRIIAVAVRKVNAKAFFFQTMLAIAVVVVLCYGSSSFYLAFFRQADFHVVSPNIRFLFIFPFLFALELILSTDLAIFDM